MAFSFCLGFVDPFGSENELAAEPEVGNRAAVELSRKGGGDIAWPPDTPKVILRWNG